MSNSNIIAGVDVGSTKIRTVITVFDKERGMPHIIGTGTSFSNGIRKGKIVDLKELVENINSSLEEAETISGIPVQSVFISVNNSQIESFESNGVVAIQGKEVEEDELKRALDAAQAVNPLVHGKNILEIIPKSYYIDNNGPLSNPVGMSGIRLEVNAQVIASTDQSIKNIEKAINQVGVEIVKDVPAVLASSDAVITKKQKEIGVVNIDIGSSSTGICVYEEGAIVYCGGLAIGGENVTNDLAIGLRSSTETAENIKLEYGNLNIDSFNDRDEIDLSAISEVDSGKVSKKQMAKIMKARYEEILYMVKHELKTIGKDGMLPGGVVLTGGGVKVPGLEELAKEVMSLPVQIGFPIDVTSVVDKIQDPQYATAIGLTKYGSRFDGGSQGLSINFGEGFGAAIKWFKNLLPS